MLIQADYVIQRPNRLIDLTGRIFTKLTVLHHAGVNKHKQHLWKCSCSCGKDTIVLGTLLRNGSTKSCGCLVIDHAKQMNPPKHGMYNTRTYHTWEGMKQRCLNPYAENYHNYGAKGVCICDRWLLFENFLADMGERPEGKTLDRIDPYGNYEPSNCRWATPKEQANNKRRRKPTEGGNSLC